MSRAKEKGKSEARTHEEPREALAEPVDGAAVIDDGEAQDLAAAATTEVPPAATGSATAEVPPDATVDDVMPPDAPVAESDTPQVSAELKAVVEALIFASPEPLALKALRKLLDGETVEAIAAAVAAVRSDYDNQARGLQLVEVAGGYQIVTRSELHEWVRRLFHERTTQKLSVQSLETLAVIAYKQPVTAAEITEIRGVNSSGVLGTLVDRHLIKIAGRKQVVGRPFMYATTREFLDRFGLRDLTELPKIEDMADALGFEPPSLQDTANTPLPFDAEEPDLSEPSPPDTRIQ